MKNKQLLNAMGEISEEYIAEAAPEKKKGNHHLSNYLKWGSAACLALAIAGGGFWFLSAPHYEKKLISSNQITSLMTGDEIAVIPQWKDQTMLSRYPTLLFNGRSYSGSGEITGAVIEDAVCSETLYGWDVYTETKYQIQATVYPIEGISDECALALQFEGSDSLYVYRNSAYRPDTLGDLIEDLNLRETLSFGSIYYNGQKRYGKPITVEFVDPDPAAIWELLLSDSSLVNLYDKNYTTPLISDMAISINAPLLGHTNISLSVTRTGYMYTNLLDSAKIFFIGEEKAEAFIQYIQANCKGYELVYDESVLGDAE